MLPMHGRIFISIMKQSIVSFNKICNDKHDMIDVMSDIMYEAYSKHTYAMTDYLLGI
jgi:flavorubredoxin